MAPGSSIRPRAVASAAYDLYAATEYAEERR